MDLGEDLLEVLAVYPDYQEKLKHLLLVAMASRSFPVPIPNHTAQRLGKNQLLVEMEILRLRAAFRNNPQVPPAARLVGNLVRTVRSRGFSRLVPSYCLAVVALAIMMSGGILTLTASASSQPGDMLYNLKLSMERVHLAFTFNAEFSQANPNQGDDDLEMVTGEEYFAPRTTDRSILVLHGITYQLNQDGRPGVGVEAETQAQTESSPPSFTNAQTNSNNGNDKASKEESDETADAPGDGNQGKAFGKAKTTMARL